MKFFISLLITVSSICVAQGISKKAIHDTTIWNSQVVAERFASKLIRGKLDKRGYAALKEKVGVLEPGQKLRSTQPIFVKGSLKIYNESDYENSWHVSLVKVSGGVPNNAPPVFTALVHCKVVRTHGSIRGSPYQWYPDCKVIGVIQE